MLISLFYFSSTYFIEMQSHAPILENQVSPYSALGHHGRSEAVLPAFGHTDSCTSSRTTKMLGCYRKKEKEVLG
jgi:hypothetical protein